jgi:isopropylmalate/homocitrate/citramalate synthase
MPTPWHTNQWFTSPWNFVPEVREGFQFAEKIEFHDITLRDGEQQAGLVYTVDEKLRIAEKLAEAGVQRIEAGMVAVSPQDKEAVERIVKMGLPSKIFAFSRCMAEDVEKAADTGVDGICVEIPASEHIIEKAYGWPLEKAIELSIGATAKAHELGLYTVFFPIDASRADMTWFLSLIERVATEGHMDALACVDTFGGTSPHAVPLFVREARKRLPGKGIELHLHDDFGMAVAATIAGLAAGADVAHVTVSGIGERAGNCALEDTVMALRTMYDVDCGIDTTKFVELSRIVQEASGFRVPPNRAIVGERLFNIESGIIAAWAQACREDNWLELFPYHWDMVGQKRPEIVLGKHSGGPSVLEWREKLGMSAELAKEELLERLMRVKQAALDKKGLLTEEEGKDIVG